MLYRCFYDRAVGSLRGYAGATFCSPGPCLIQSLSVFWAAVVLRPCSALSAGRTTTIISYSISSSIDPFFSLVVAALRSFVGELCVFFFVGVRLVASWLLSLSSPLTGVARAVRAYAHTHEHATNTEGAYDTPPYHVAGGRLEAVGRFQGQLQSSGGKREQLVLLFLESRRRSSGQLYWWQQSKAVVDYLVGFV